MKNQKRELPGVRKSAGGEATSGGNGTCVVGTAGIEEGVERAGGSEAGGAARTCEGTASINRGKDKTTPSDGAG